MFLLLRVDDSFLQSALEGGRAVYNKWLSGVLDRVKHDGKKLAILEVGAGFNTPGVIRMPNERLAYTDGVQLIRVNPEYPEMPFQSHGVGVPEDANAVRHLFVFKLKRVVAIILIATCIVEFL